MIAKKWKLRTRILSLELPKIMGVLNVTPDSFSDGGKYLEPGDAVKRALTMAEEGADLIDVGAESSRPGAKAVDAGTEWNRLAPVLERLVQKLSIPISVDTRKAEIAHRALDLGAEIINDISGGGDPEMIPLLAREKAGYVLMHMRGDPGNMMEKSDYSNVLENVSAELGNKLEAAARAGIDKGHLCIDPGFGFAKNPKQNYLLMENLAHLAEWGYPLLIGVSRKRMLRELVGNEEQALAGSSVAAALVAYTRGARIFRVHDVAETKAAFVTFQELTKDLKDL